MNQQERLKKLIDYISSCEIVRNEDIVFYLLRNGVIVPPCAIMQTVFVVPTIDNGLPDVTEMQCIGFAISHDSTNVNLVNKKNKLYQPSFGDFGKTVFLRKKEAEAELGRRKNETNL